MKNRNTVNWIRGITLGIAATALVLLLGCNSVQMDKPVSSVESISTPKIKEEKNLTIPLSETVSLDMIWIEPGTFMMGSPVEELGRDDDEIQREVTLTKGYWLGKYEVTQEQYKTIMGNNPSKFVGNNLPVEQVSWNDAIEFCRKLTDKLGDTLPKGYECSLPTEAQWEYACRAGTTSSLNSGRNVTSAKRGLRGVCDNLDEVGWYWMNGGMKNWNEGKNPSICTHPVGQKKPNAWGLYDMHGNVNEWCLDWYGGYSPGSVTDPKGPSTGTNRVGRGGGWSNAPRHCRSADRDWGTLEDRVDFLGFRVALAPIQYNSVQTSAQTKSVAEPVRTVEIKTGENYTLPLSEKVSLDMIWIEPGTFMMGSPTDELGRSESYDETQHEVTLTRGYWLGKYEITQEQYRVIMDENPSMWQGENLPVEMVSWNDAKKFCEKLTVIEKKAGRLMKGYEYTLPTEAQWEYACRAETVTAFNNGKNIPAENQKIVNPCPNLDLVAWYWFNSDYKTHSVGQKEPNAWGLYDMHGNVWEWCLDGYGDYQTSPATDPVGPTNFQRVTRGGSYFNHAYDCRSADRLYHHPSKSGYNFLGFRVALAPILYDSEQTKSVTEPIETVEIKAGMSYTLPLSEDVNLDMIWIESGTFMMGSPTNELGRDDDEIQHKVTLTQGYWLGKYEVTQSQYETVMGTNPSDRTGYDGEYYGVGDNYPVYYVSWFDAMKFCKELTKIEKEAERLPEGYEYILPTEAQWEYACRAGTTTVFNNGKNIPTWEQRVSNPCPNLDEVGWYCYNSRGKTHPVGRKQPNAWGLYDMHGNVEEWCLNWYDDYPTSPVTDPMGPALREVRIIRSGSWGNSAGCCRSAMRGGCTPDTVWEYGGFRIALAPIQYNSVQTKSVTEPIETVEIKAGESYTLPLSEEVNLDMIWIEPGTFIMGSSENELGRDDNEIQHEVTLTQGYWLGKYEVTQSQYEIVMETNPSEFRGDDLPVDSVSWNHAKRFCVKLTAIEKEAGRLPEGYEYTLPTEAQWEYACRAGTTTALNNGKNISTKEQTMKEPCHEMDEVGWYTHNSDRSTHSVGQKQANAWGLYDMHGNVEEWCLDRYGDYPISTVTDPIGPSTGEYHVLRGGCYGRLAVYCRSAFRSGKAPNISGYNGYYSNGFRLALVPVQ